MAYSILKVDGFFLLFHDVRIFLNDFVRQMFHFIVGYNNYTVFILFIYLHYLTLIYAFHILVKIFSKRNLLVSNIQILVLSHMNIQLMYKR